MSTRCQVRISSGNELSKNSPDFFAPEPDTMLYHHCDGYPSNMIPIIAKTFRWGYKPRTLYKGGEPNIYYRYQMDRPGYIASHLCYHDPTGFSVENLDVGLHGDIEWYYKINTKGSNDSVKWEVSIYSAQIQREGDPKLHLVLTGDILKLVTRKNQLTEETEQKIAEVEKEIYGEASV